MLAKPGASLVLAGPHQPVVVQLLVYGINSALKNIGDDADRARVRPESERRTAFCNWPARSVPAGSSSFSFSAAIRFTTRRADYAGSRDEAAARLARSAKKVPDVVRLGYYEDATSALSHWHVPAAHYLEAWGDALTSDGAYLAIQPMILPLFGGLSEIELMNALLGGPKVEGPELVQETFRATAPPGDFATAWSQVLARRIRVAHSSSTTSRRRSTATPPAASRTRFGRRRRAPTPDSPEIVLVAQLRDGRRPLHQQRLAPGNARPDHETDLGQCRADEPGVRANISASTTGDLDQITVTDKAPDAQKQQSDPARAGHRRADLPGHADNSITIPLGYGRKQTGPVGEEAGFNGLSPAHTARIRISSSPTARRSKRQGRRKSAGTYALSITQDHWSIEGRGLVREATLEHYREDNEFVKKIAGDDELPTKLAVALHASAAQRRRSNGG